MSQAVRARTAAVDAARVLNRAGISAAPLRTLPALSIYVDDEYENYDIDLVPPRQRLRLLTALEEDGYEAVSGRSFRSPEGDVELLIPRVAGTLGSDPSAPVLRLLDRDDAILLITPTQAVLALLHRHREDWSEDNTRDLAALVHEQPANLDKVADWANAADLGRRFATIRGRLESAQEEGIRLRRERRFESRLPR